MQSNDQHAELVIARYRLRRPVNSALDVAMRFDERQAIEELYSRLEQEIDSLAPHHREKIVHLLRESFAWEGDSFTPEDERIIRSFGDSAISIRRLEEHFGERLTNVLLRGRENGDA